MVKMWLTGKKKAKNSSLNGQMWRPRINCSNFEKCGTLLKKLNMVSMVLVRIH